MNTRVWEDPRRAQERKDAELLRKSMTSIANMPTEVINKEFDHDSLVERFKGTK